MLELRDYQDLSSHECFPSDCQALSFRAMVELEQLVLVQLEQEGQLAERLELLALALELELVAWTLPGLLEDCPVPSFRVCPASVFRVRSFRAEVSLVSLAQRLEVG